MRKIIIAIALLLAAGSAFGQITPTLVSASQGVASFFGMSAANAAQSVIVDLRSTHDTLAISAVCSAGTATLIVATSIDGSNFNTTIDSLTAASPQVKQYTATTAGATTAVSPLAFRYVQITVGTCGSSNTSTLTVSAK